MKSIKVGIIIGTLSLLLSVIVDSYFWEELIWPEGTVFWYNTYLNKSSNWGTSPFHWYFTNALPRSLLISFPLVFLSLYIDFNRSAPLLFPILLFLFIYSFLPHKELRFIFYVIPIFNLISSITLFKVYLLSLRSKFYNLIYKLTIIGMLLSFGISCSLLYVSSTNYPGGNALYKLHNIDNINNNNNNNNNGEYKKIHMDVLTCMTGVSRYSQIYNNWSYFKNESLSSYDSFDFVLSEKSNLTGFHLLFTELGFDKININLSFRLNNPVVLSPKIYVYSKEKLK